MPWKAKRACAYKRCPNLAVRGERYCLEHMHKKRERRRRYEQDNAARIAKQRADYERRTQRGSADDRGYDAKWAEVRNAYIKRYPRCERCGQRADTVHHITPLKQGGARLDPSNLMSLCNSCHNRVHGR